MLIPHALVGASFSTNRGLPNQSPLLYPRKHLDTFEKAKLSKVRFAGPREDFFQAIRAGNAEKVTQLIEALPDEGGPDTYRDAQENTGLMQAAYYGKLGVAKELFAAGANLEATNAEGNTAWLIAAQRGQTSVLNFLLTQMKKSEHFTELLNAKNKDGNTAIMLAAEAGQYNTVKLLMQYKANLNVTNASGEDVFALAQSNQYQKIHRLLKGEKEDVIEPTRSIVVATPDTQPIIKAETQVVIPVPVSDEPPERALIGLFKKAGRLSELENRDAFLTAISSPECKEYFVSRLQRDMAKPDQATIIRNKLCYLYSKETLQQAKDFWNEIAKAVFKEPIGVLAGMTGLHQILGMDDIKQDLLAQVIYPLTHNDPKFNSLLILYGPPGGGKTLIAQCVAEHLDYPMSQVITSKLLTNQQGRAFYGEPSARITKLFERAKKQAPAVLFFDEFDGIARRRSGESANSSSTDTTQLINEINELIKFNQNSPKKVLVIGAANNLQHIDDAIYRSQRAYNVEIPPCNDETKLAILQREFQTHSRDIVFDESFDTQAFASQLVNSPVDITPSDIKATFQHATNTAKYFNHGIITEAILQKSLETTLKTKQSLARQSGGTAL